MKQKGKILYLSVCLSLCMLPFAGMAVFSSSTPPENRRQAEFPALKMEGQWNVQFLQELGEYFESHFAFRPLLVSGDALIQSKVFGVSNVENVTVGEDGWLYYTATLDDYLGKNMMSARGVKNAAHNLSLVQQYVEGQGARFAFTIAPNKNSLYGEHMPYYLRQEGERLNNRKRLEPELAEAGISYVNLFSLFGEQEETLYLKRDSHWNQKGAVMAYHALLEQAGYWHDTYETEKFLRLKETYGDLNRMLYPLGGEPEWDYACQKEHTYSYRTDTGSVEDAWIETANSQIPPDGGTLLMFRDSFGNSLLPLFADAFAKGCFSKGVPWNIGEYMETHQPDVVVGERVERELPEFAQRPPLMEGLEVELEGEIAPMGKLPAMQGEIAKDSPEMLAGQGTGEIAKDSPEVLAGQGTGEEGQDFTIAEFSECGYSEDYWEISGMLGKGSCTEDVKVYLRVSQGEESKIYEPFYLSTEQSDYGYCLYLKKEHLLQTAMVEVITEQDGNLQAVQALMVPM